MREASQLHPGKTRCGHQWFWGAGVAGVGLLCGTGPGNGCIGQGVRRGLTLSGPECQLVWVALYADLLLTGCASGAYPAPRVPLAACEVSTVRMGQRSRAQGTALLSDGRSALITTLLLVSLKRSQMRDARFVSPGIRS